LPRHGWQSGKNRSEKIKKKKKKKKKIKKKEKKRRATVRPVPLCSAVFDETRAGLSAKGLVEA